MCDTVKLLVDKCEKEDVELDVVWYDNPWGLSVSETDFS